MRNCGDFCPKCPKGKPIVRFVHVFVDLGGVLSCRKERISACTSYVVVPACRGA